MKRSWWLRLAMAGAIVALGLLLNERIQRPAIAPRPVAAPATAALPDADDADAFLEREQDAPKAAGKAGIRREAPLAVNLGSSPTILQAEDGFVRTGNDISTQEFRPEGVRVSGEAGRLDFSLRDIRIGGKSLRSGGWLSDGKPVVEQDHVVYRRGSVTEKYALLNQGVEQIFVLGSELSALQRDGDLTVTVGLDSTLKRTEKLRSRGAKEDALEFKGDGSASFLRYGGATAIDADGKRRDLSYEVRGDELAMVLDAGFLSSARFPLTIDPPVVQVTPLSLDFFAPFGGPNPAPKRVVLKNAGTGQLKWKATTSQPWIICSPAQGARQDSMKKNVNISVNVLTLAVGDYDETVTFQPKSGPGGTVVVDVHVHIKAGPWVLLDPTSLVFDSPGGVGTPDPLPQTVTVQNVGPGTLTWDASALVTTPPAGTWLHVNPVHGTLAPGATATLTVSVTHGALADGTYTGTISVANNSVPPVVQPAQTCAITLNVSSNPFILLSPAAGLTFDVSSAGGSGTASQPMSVMNAGGGTLTWTATAVVTTPGGGTWLAVSPTAGSLSAGGSAPLTVTVTRGALAAGSYDGLITVTSGVAPNSPQSIPITLNINDQPTITLNPTSLSFTAALNGTPPASKTVALSNTGTGTLAWTATKTNGATWLTVSPTSGSLLSGAPTTLTISVDQTGLTAQTYTETIEITDPNATNPTELIFVTLDVVNVPTIGLNPTSFTFSAPLNGTPPVSQPLTVTNVGSGTLTWTATPSDPWITVTPPNGSAGAGGFSTPAISVDQTGLAAGTYNGTILIADAAASNSPQTVTVTLVVNTNPTIGFSPSSLTFNAPLGGAAPASQGLTISNLGNGTLNWTATETETWITSITPAGGALSGGASTLSPIQVSVSQAGLTAGVYNGVITITAAGATNTPQQVPVTLVVNNTPTIGLSSNSFSFTAPQGGATPADQTVTITNTGTGTLNWVGTPSQAWLSIEASTGGLAGGGFENRKISVNQAGLTPGVYNATIAISAAGASNTPQTINVSLTVTAAATPSIGLSATSYTFNAPQGGAPPATQNVDITNTGGGTLNWTATFSDPWMTLAPATTGSSGAGSFVSRAITIDQTGLVGGTYNGTITITDLAASNSPRQITVTLNVLTTPAIGLSPTTLTFTAFVGGTSPGSQTVAVSNTGTGTLNWTAVSNDPSWLSVTPAGGTNAGTLTISVDITGLPAGGMSGSITVSCPGAANDPQLITVNLSLLVPLSFVLPKAGYCGATGLELLLPFAFIWGARRFRRNGRKLPASLGRLGVFLAVLILGSAQAWAGEDDLPRSLQQEEKPPRPEAPVPPKPEQAEGGDPDVLDFSKSALDAHLGFAKFSSKFKDNGAFVGGIQYRIPSPLLSSIVDTDPERIGVFLDLSVSSINRDIPSTFDKSGMLLFATLGTDAAFYKDEDWDFRGQVGVQYGYFGGVDGLDNGIAFLVGLRGALNLGEGIWLVLNPQFAIAKDSNNIFFLNVGAEIKF